MTTPPKMRKIADLVREAIPFWRKTLTKDEAELAPFIRGNKPLYEALAKYINARITGRAALSVPNDPVMCKAILDRDHELRWLLGRLDYIYRSPVATAEGDQSA